MVLAAALGLEPRTPTFRVWCATNCTTRQSGKAYRWVKMRARSGELGWGVLLRPESPGGVHEENGEGPAGNEFRDFLDEERAEDGAEHSGEGTGGGDFPVDRV